MIGFLDARVGRKSMGRISTLARHLRNLADRLENRHQRHHPYVRTPESVRQDIRRIMAPWPDKTFTFNEIYCRSSMGVDLERGLHEMIDFGFVLVVGSDRGDLMFQWNAKA